MKPKLKINDYWKGGTWQPPDLMKNNPEGYNKHKKNKNKKPEAIPVKKTKQELLEELGELGHKIWLMQRERLSIGHRMAKINEELNENGNLL